MIPQRTDGRQDWRWRLLRRLTGGATLLVAAFLGLTPMGCYLSRAAYEEARILARRQPIDALVVRDRTDPVLRAKLQLVQEARQYAIDSLGLKAGNSFTAYSPLDRDTLVLVVSAAYRDRLELKSWWFPVVGRFPYKGYFDFAEAERAAAQLRAEGMDVVVGASSAFSTLGWFNDPLVSTTARMDSVTLVNTVFHELLHNTFFAKGQVAFNESFASFVGGRGAEQFFRARAHSGARTGVRAAGDSALLKRAEDDWHDDRALGAFWSATSRALESAYAAWPDSARTARLAARDTVYAHARRQLVDSVGPMLRTYPREWPARVPLNNAMLLARRVYAQGLDRFDSVYLAHGADLRRAVEAVRGCAPAKGQTVPDCFR